MRQRLLTSLLPCLVAAFAVACEADRSELTGACDVDSDCVPGLKCYAHRLCVTPDVQDTPVVVRLVPPVGSGLLVEQFQLTLSGAAQSEGLKLQLSAPAVLRGTVSRAGTPLAGSIPGTLIATAPSDFAGGELRYDAPSVEFKKPTGDEIAPHSFELRVQRGHTYDLAFWPQSPEIPPHYSSITVGGSIEGWKVELPAEPHLHRISGTLVAAGVPLVGLRVSLEDQAGRLCSTRVVTDATGSFELRADAPGLPEFSPGGRAPKGGAKPWGRLLFEPADPQMPLPRGMLHAKVPLPKPTANATPLALGILDVGPIPTAQPVTVKVVAQGGGPVSGAQVRIRRQLPGPKASGKELDGLYVEMRGITNQDGVFVTSVPPGPAMVTVLTLPKSPHGRSQPWKGDLAAGELTVTCPLRQTVQGVVEDYAGREVPGAQVVLRRLRTADIDTSFSDGSMLGGDEAIEADDLGGNRFSARVDPGTYAIWVQPPPTAGLPRMLVKVAELDPGKDLTCVLALKPPMVLAGNILSAQGKPLQGVLVDVLAAKVNAPPSEAAKGKPAQDRAPLEALALHESHLLATTVSTAHGAFEVLLAAGQVAK